MYGLAILAEQGNVLAIDASALIVFVTALVLVWVLDPLLFKPINHVLDERQRRTQGYHAEARAMLAESEHKLARYEEAVRRSRAETYEMLEQQRQQALERRAQIIGATKQEVAGQIAEARQHIQQQVNEAKQQLAADSQRTAQRIAAGVLGRPTEEVRRAT